MKTLERETETGEAQREPFKPNDVLKQVVIPALAVAPDGESIVYVKRTVEDNRYARRLWRVGFSGGDPEQLTTASCSDGRPRFSPDGTQLLFISDRSGKPQAWVMSTRGGEAKQVTDLPSGVAAADWSPDGKRLLVLAGSGDKRFIVGKEDDPTARRIRDYTWRIDGGGIRDEFTSVWIVDMSGGKPVRITAPTYNVENAVWSPDGAQVAFIADLGQNAGLDEIGALWTLPAEPDPNASPKEIATLKSGVFSLAWSPSTHIAYLGVDKPDFPGWPDPELHVSDGARRARLGADRHLRIGVSSYGDYIDAENLFAYPISWFDERNVLTLVSHRGASQPYRFGLDGSVENLAETGATCFGLATGGGRIAVVAATDKPMEVYAVEGGKLRPLTTDGSKWYGPFHRTVEETDIKHPDGHSIHTRLLLARGARVKAPLVIDVHGGPSASFGPTPWLEMNALADAGFHVAWPNPRGSVSYGEEYARALDRRWGDADASDVLRVLEWAVDEGLADRERVGIMGLSYGGYLTNWMIANHPGVFQAAVSENPVTDLVLEWGTSDFGRHLGLASAGAKNPWEDPAGFAAHSPTTRMHQNVTPLLLLQAENDLRCPPGNSETVFLILRTLGREVEMIRYPGESHIMLGIGRPDRRVDRLERIVDWFTKHLGPAA
ncbi:MAG TPA: S9 family peptidase [Candidatus Dormibacteraeota bacterium]|nr:S9 family peptidase [Candidatus Dormibacteraeota bacterium]